MLPMICSDEDIENLTRSPNQHEKGHDIERNECTMFHKISFKHTKEKVQKSVNVESFRPRKESSIEDCFRCVLG